MVQAAASSEAAGGVEGADGEDGGVEEVVGGPVGLVLHPVLVAEELAHLVAEDGARDARCIAQAVPSLQAPSSSVATLPSGVRMRRYSLPASKK